MSDRTISHQACQSSDLGSGGVNNLRKAFGSRLSEVDRPSNSAQPTNAEVKDPGHHCRKLSDIAASQLLHSLTARAARPSKSLLDGIDASFDFMSSPAPSPCL